ncbi:hypothetical protein [Oscillatoria sp. FACHB-1406]|uniref:hypothetical protein n=1 Tax=Oscillatoria sp. FACHB-1406 TaxID=2692846 RepID=UPI001685BC08|nr:hypothetical protein [Oscillatoria sp. FACHB-1406]MBD2576266.1 hypothetical protein [Oscillatoria sp. FACHB-1406]
MNQDANAPICRHTFAAQNLMDSHPPKVKNPNKKIVFDIASPPEATHSGEIVFSRWKTMPLPPTVAPTPIQTELEVREDHFTYESPSNASVEWYLNFAHSNLFCAYSGPLFAQDEMQAAEHPALGALREALLAAAIEPLTVESAQPTPILIRGVERRCAVATEPNEKAGRPYGLYGNQFAKASPEAIARATTQLNPPTRTNLIAMEAPFGGYRQYLLEDIEYILSTAFTGFAAARLESQIEAANKPQVIIHTGFWGCGAYGGNRVLMTLLQLLAAHLNQIDKLVFHAGNHIGAQSFLRAREILESDLLAESNEIVLPELLKKIEGMGFEWGVSDGN